MYNNPYGKYNPTFSQQNMFEQIDGQINQLQQMKEQMRTQQPAINQTFQLAPNNHGIRYANTIDEVSKEAVFYDTPFFSKDMSVVWIKNNNNEIKTYEMTEIVPKDDKDLQIEYLTSRLNELERRVIDEQSNTNVITTKDATNTTGNDEAIGEPIEESKPSRVSRVSKSKTK